MSLKIEVGMVLHRTAHRIMGGSAMVNLLNVAVGHHLIAYDANEACTALVIGYPSANREHLRIGLPMRIESAFLTAQYFEFWTPSDNILLYRCESVRIDIGFARVARKFFNLAQMENAAIVRATRHFLLDPARELDCWNIKCATCALWYLLLEKERVT